MARNSWMLAVLILLLARTLPGADALNAPSIPDPYGLGPRLALIDYLENTLHASVAPGASYDDLVACYWSLVDKPKTNAESAKLDHIEQMQFILKADFGVDASQITDEELLSARIKQCEADATINLTETARADAPVHAVPAQQRRDDAPPVAGPTRPAPEAVPTNDPDCATAPLWLTDYQEAVRQSRTTDRPILVDFTGSDWCPWCIRLHNEVFNKEAFATWAANHVVLLKVDFPQNIQLPPELAKQNLQLAQAYDVKGFPTVLILTAEGKLLGHSGYRSGGAPAWIEALVGSVSELR